MNSRWSHTGCFSERGLRTLEFESQPCQPLETQRNRASGLRLLLYMVSSAMLRTLKNKIYFIMVLESMQSKETQYLS